MGKEQGSVEAVSLHGYRGLEGVVELGSGLNIVVGPNASGKTSLIEAALVSLAVNYTDIRLTNYYILIMNAARGSEKHALAAMAPLEGTPVRACVRVSGESACAVIAKSSRHESRLHQIVPVIEVSVKAERRECSLKYVLKPTSLGFMVNGGSCFTNEMSVGFLTPGVMPYNFFDRLAARLKREHGGLGALSIQLGGKRFRVDLASDDWDELAAYVVEESGAGKPEMVIFYSAGRGIQRSLQYLLQLQTSSIILVDEIESAMHPELLEAVAVKTVEAVERGKQVVVTTQSLEAARMLAAALASADPRAWRAPSKLLEHVSRACSDPATEERLEELLSLIVLDRRGARIESLRLTGCSALSHIAGSRDVRLSYTLI